MSGDGWGSARTNSPTTCRYLGSRKCGWTRTWFPALSVRHHCRSRRRLFVQPNWQTSTFEILPALKSSILFELPDARSEQSVCEVLAWGQVRPGQWYPQVIRTTTFILGDEGTWREGVQDRLRRGELPWRGSTQRGAAGYTAVRSELDLSYILIEPLEQVDESGLRCRRSWLDVPAEPG